MTISEKVKIHLSRIDGKARCWLKYLDEEREKLLYSEEYRKNFNFRLASFWGSVFQYINWLATIYNRKITYKDRDIASFLNITIDWDYDYALIFWTCCRHPIIHTGQPQNFTISSKVAKTKRLKGINKYPSLWINKFSKNSIDDLKRTIFLKHPEDPNGLIVNYHFDLVRIDLLLLNKYVIEKIKKIRNKKEFSELYSLNKRFPY